MANVYYSDTLGTNLNVFEKKTKGGEPFYYIYLNKTKITESDVKVKLLGVMQFSSPTNLNIKVKEGKIAWTISWSYTKPTSLADQEKLFEGMFSWLKGYGYVDSYQPKATKTTTRRKTTPTLTTTTTNLYGVPLINIENPVVIKKGDLFYFYASIESPCLITDYDPSSSNFDFTRYVKPNLPQYETIRESTLRNYINQDEAFLCKTTDGGYFVNSDNTFSLMIEPMKSNGSFEMIVNEDGVERKGGLPNEEQLGMFICANRLMPKLPPNSTTTPQITSLQYYDLFKRVRDGKLFRVLHVEGVMDKNDVFYDIPDNSLVDLESYDEIAKDFMVQNITFGDLKKNIERNDLYYIGQVRKGDSFIDKRGTMEREVTYVEDYPHDVFFNINDLNFTPPKLLNSEVLVMNVFTRSLLNQGYKLNLRLGNTNTNTTNTNTSQVKIGDLIIRKDGTLEVVVKTDTSVGTSLIVTSEYKGYTNDLMVDVSSIQFLIENENTIHSIEQGDSFKNEKDVDVVEVKEVDNALVTYTYLGSVNVLSLVGFGQFLVRKGFRFNGNARNKTTPQVPTNVTPKPQISDAEIDALKKELGDLIFLKSGISDLDFEEKINISTEIFETQKKIDGLTEKLFEQRVGDENFFDRLFEQSFTPLKSRYDMVIQKNVLPEILSPSGEMSDLDENMQILINSNEFKEWFGDWRNAFFYRNLPDFGGLNVSKVLNDKFEPQLVWHGTNNEFSYFDFEMFPANYFAVNREYSEFFAINKGGKGYVLPFFLDIKNPLDLSYFENDYVSLKDFFDWMYLMTGMTAEELDVNPLFLDPTMQPQPIWMYIRNNPTMLQKIAQGKVYDGIKFYEFNPNEKDNADKKAYETLAYIIFDPHQAKLADPSRGDILLASLKSFMLKRGGKI
jgi:hypothetical protein